MRWKSLKAPVLVVLSITLTATGLYVFKPSAEKQPVPAQALLPVNAVQVTPQDFQVVIASQGRVEAKHQVELAAQVQGTIQSRHPSFERGGYFHKGDVLVNIDDGDYRAALQAALAELSSTQHRLSEAKAQSTAAIADWKRQGYKREPSDYVAKRTQVAAAQAAQEAAEANVLRAQLDLQRTRIIAPFDGHVISDVPDAGNFLSPGKVLGTIVATNKLKVSLPISANWRNMIALPKDLTSSASSNAVTLHLPNIPDAHWQAQLLTTSADIDSQSRQMTVIADIDTLSGSRKDIPLLIGDYVQADIKGRLLKQVFVVPRYALRDGHFVWQIQDNKLYKKHVTVIWKDAEVAVIREGLNPGDTIATSRLSNVISGTEVTISKPNNKNTVNNTPNAGSAP